MTAITWILKRGERDHGSALVAALGVAMIGIAFSVIAVSVAMTVTNDSSRDRVRTTEIHAAESVLDTTILSLEAANVCVVPDQVVGGGANSVTVSTEITYFDADHAELTSCSGGEIVGTPASATVKSTATPVTVRMGIAPSRTIEATVLIQPVEVESSGSAIFSGGTFSTGGGFSVGPSSTSDRARVWIDSGSWTCQTSVTINGDLVVPTGSVTFGNGGCNVTGDVWARDGFTANSTPTYSYTIGGNLTVEKPAGCKKTPCYGLTLGNGQRFGGNVSIGGPLIANPTTNTQWKNTTVAGTTCSTNFGSPCGTLDSFVPMGFPIINYTPTDFTGYTIKTAMEFEAAIETSWTTMNADQKTKQRAKPCSPLAYITTTPIRLPAIGNANTIYNCTASPWGADSGGGVVTLKLYADIVIYSKSFAAPNGLTIISGDNQPHNIYLIVPKTVAGLSGYTPGNIGFTSGGIQVTSPVAIFVYTPMTLNFPNLSSTTGQLYAGSVTVGAGTTGSFLYKPMPLPYGYLSTETTESEGFTVQIVSKHES